MTRVWAVAENQDQASSILIVSTPTGEHLDRELGFQVPEDGDWEIEVWSIFQTTVNCDVVTIWYGDFASATHRRGCVGATNTAGSFTNRANTNGTVRSEWFEGGVTYQIEAAAGQPDQLVYERGIWVGANEGEVLQFAWRQATPTNTNLIRAAGSILKATKIPA